MTEAQRIYNKSEKAKAAQRRYKLSEKGRARDRRARTSEKYKQRVASEKYKEQKRKYSASPKARALARAYALSGKAKAARRKYEERHREIRRETSRQTFRKLRQLVLNQYGRSCACCGESIEAFLAIDHINGGGNTHRKSITTGFYQWLKNNHCPPGFQTLCHNCNKAKHRLGICPHQSMKLGEELGSSPNHAMPQ